MSHTQQPHPVARPNFFFNARFENTTGPWDEWEFKVDFYDENHNLRTQTFAVGVTGTGMPAICLAAGKDVNDILAQEFNAHARMGSWLSGRIPGTTEWANDFIGEGASQNFQMSIGVVKMEDYTQVDDQAMDIRFKLGNNGPFRTVRMDYTEMDLRSYQFDPRNQIYILPGAIQIGLGYDHKSSGVLTSQEQQDIIDFVAGLAPYI